MLLRVHLLLCGLCHLQTDDEEDLVDARRGLRVLRRSTSRGSAASATDGVTDADLFAMGKGNGGAPRPVSGAAASETVSVGAQASFAGHDSDGAEESKLPAWSTAAGDSDEYDSDVPVVHMSGESSDSEGDDSDDDDDALLVADAGTDARGTRGWNGPAGNGPLLANRGVLALVLPYLTYHSAVAIGETCSSCLRASERNSLWKGYLWRDILPRGGPKSKRLRSPSSHLNYRWEVRKLVMAASDVRANEYYRRFELENDEGFAHVHIEVKRRVGLTNIIARRLASVRKRMNVCVRSFSDLVTAKEGAEEIATMRGQLTRVGATRKREQIEHRLARRTARIVRSSEYLGLPSVIDDDWVEIVDERINEIKAFRLQLEEEERGLERELKVSKSLEERLDEKLTSVLRRRWLKLSLKHHPDKPTGDAARFKQLSVAAEVLLNAERRTAYNLAGHDAFLGGLSDRAQRAAAEEADAAVPEWRRRLAQRARRRGGRVLTGGLPTRPSIPVVVVQHVTGQVARANVSWGFNSEMRPDMAFVASVYGTGVGWQPFYRGQGCRARSPALEAGRHYAFKVQCDSNMGMGPPSVECYAYVEALRLKRRSQRSRQRRSNLRCCRDQLLDLALQLVPDQFFVTWRDHRKGVHAARTQATRREQRVSLIRAVQLWSSRVDTAPLSPTAPLPRTLLSGPVVDCVAALDEQMDAWRDLSGHPENPVLLAAVDAVRLTRRSETARQAWTTLRSLDALLCGGPLRDRLMDRDGREHDLSALRTAEVDAAEVELGQLLSACATIVGVAGEQRNGDDEELARGLCNGMYQVLVASVKRALRLLANAPDVSAADVWEREGPPECWRGAIALISAVRVLLQRSERSVLIPPTGGLSRKQRKQLRNDAAAVTASLSQWEKALRSAVAKLQRERQQAKAAYEAALQQRAAEEAKAARGGTGGDVHHAAGGAAQTEGSEDDDDDGWVTVVKKPRRPRMEPEEEMATDLVALWLDEAIARIGGLRM